MFQIHKSLYKKSRKGPMNLFPMYLQTNGKNRAHANKVDCILLYQTNASIMGLMTNIDTMHTLGNEILHTPI